VATASLSGGHVMSTVVKIVPNEKGNPPGKLADAELHFTDGELEGLKLIGFAIWERRSGTGRNVTFPARQYSVNGERRSFALLRPITDTTAQERVRELELEAYTEYEERAWLTVEEAAQRARCGVKTLYREVRSGRLRAARVGGRRELRLLSRWVDEWLVRSTTTTLA